MTRKIAPRRLLLLLLTVVFFTFVPSVSNAEIIDKCEYDCSCDPYTDPSCPYDPYTVIVVPEECDPWVTPGCDELNADLIEATNKGCSRPKDFRACYRACRDKYHRDIDDKCDAMIWGWKTRCQMEAARQLINCATVCEADHCS